LRVVQANAKRLERSWRAGCIRSLGYKSFLWAVVFSYFTLLTQSLKFFFTEVRKLNLHVFCASSKIRTLRAHVLLGLKYQNSFLSTRWLLSSLYSSPKSVDYFFIGYEYINSLFEASLLLSSIITLHSLHSKRTSRRCACLLCQFRKGEQLCDVFWRATRRRWLKTCMGALLLPENIRQVFDEFP
jgi:hypothetical protein